MFRCSLRRKQWHNPLASNPGVGVGPQLTQPKGTLGQETQGVPFYGSIYGSKYTHEEAHNFRSDKVHTLLDKGMHPRPSYNDEDPIIRAALDKCPYFSLCDMCIWGGMDPEYLDPGVLSGEEHQLLLLHGRSYFDKWKVIHKDIRDVAPGLRIKKGSYNLVFELCRMLSIPESAQSYLCNNMFDDATLVAFKTNKWKTANIEPKLRDLITGKVLEKAGVREYQIERLNECLSKMRTIKIVRKDGIQDKHEMARDYKQNMWQDDHSEDDVLVLEYKQARTLYDLYTRLGLDPYNGHIKLYNYYDAEGTRLTLTLSNEDEYFDFLQYNFYGANLHLYGYESMSKYTLVVERLENVEKKGEWF